MDSSNSSRRITDRWPEKTLAGIAITRELGDAGITGRALTVACEQGLVRRLYRGAYLPEEVWKAAKPWERDHLLLLGHVAAARTRGAYSHSSAARLHSLSTWGCGKSIHLTLPARQHPRGNGPGVVAHQQLVPGGELLRVRVGNSIVSITSLAQTVVDCARYFPPQQAVVIGDSALRRGVTVKQLSELLEASHVVRGSRRAKLLLPLLDGRCESAGESRTRLLMAHMRISQPQLQVDIQSRLGLHRVDFAWPELKLALEFDGWGKYFNYAPTQDVVALERKREKVLGELGWRFIRVFWEDLADPVALELRIANALADASARYNRSLSA